MKVAGTATGPQKIFVVVLRESAGRLEAAQRLELPEKSADLSSTLAAIPNGLLVASFGCNNIYELQSDPVGGQLAFQKSLKTRAGND